MVERLALRWPVLRQDPKALVAAGLSRHEVDVFKVGEAQRVHSVRGEVSLRCALSRPEGFHALRPAVTSRTHPDHGFEEGSVAAPTSWRALGESYPTRSGRDRGVARPQADKRRHLYFSNRTIFDAERGDLD
ncbi:hypothetical protein GCM10023191_028940 [Actinoallomurus oryzae]|uniref:Uncharacterized protein n=1 Tax=Actinoallomurus oryzae TaxID=502180 RepID=A0ABP8PW61_9ACTN